MSLTVSGLAQCIIVEEAHPHNQPRPRYRDAPFNTTPTRNTHNSNRRPRSGLPGRSQKTSTPRLGGATMPCLSPPPAASGRVGNGHRRTRRGRVRPRRATEVTVLPKMSFSMCTKSEEVRLHEGTGRHRESGVPRLRLVDGRLDRRPPRRRLVRIGEQSIVRDPRGLRSKNSSATESSRGISSTRRKDVAFAPGATLAGTHRGIPSGSLRPPARHLTEFYAVARTRRIVCARRSRVPDGPARVPSDGTGEIDPNNRERRRGWRGERGGPDRSDPPREVRKEVRGEVSTILGWPSGEPRSTKRREHAWVHCVERSSRKTGEGEGRGPSSSSL